MERGQPQVRRGEEQEAEVDGPAPEQQEQIGPRASGEAGPHVRSMAGRAQGRLTTALSRADATPAARDGPFARVGPDDLRL